MLLPLLLPSWKMFCNICPLVSILTMQLNNEFFFLCCPFLLGNCRVKAINPPISALFGRSRDSGMLFEWSSDIRPMANSAGSNTLNEEIILFFTPWMPRPQRDPFLWELFLKQFHLTKGVSLERNDCETVETVETEIKRSGPITFRFSHKLGSIYFHNNLQLISYLTYLRPFLLCKISYWTR